MLYSIESALEEVEREKARVLLHYLSMIYSQRPVGKEDPRFTQERKNFIESIKPGSNKPEKKKAIVYDWDEELMKRLASRQKGG